MIDLRLKNIVKIITVGTIIIIVCIGFTIILNNIPATNVIEALSTNSDKIIEGAKFILK